MRLRHIAAILCAALLALSLGAAGGAWAEDDRACAWVGDTEVCVPPR